jgi:V-type H+-transporting ATPase subunit a
MYKEINPAVFAIVTFPFLYGVMYGDVGHGGILLSIGIITTLFDSKIRNAGSVGAGVSSLRYLILLMGIFAFYNGFIYNEWFAIPLEVFPSCFSKDIEILSVNTALKAGTTNDYEYTGLGLYGFKRT